MSTMRELPPRDTPLPAFSTETSLAKFSLDNPADMLACQFITERYRGEEIPIIVFIRDDCKIMVVPRTITPVFFKRKGDDAKQVTTETPRLLSGPSPSRG